MYVVNVSMFTVIVSYSQDIRFCCLSFAEVVGHLAC